MKFRILVSALAGVAVCATSLVAQVCQGDLPFRASSTHVGAALGVSDNATSFGAGLTHGRRQGWYSGGSLGLRRYSSPQTSRCKNGAELRAVLGLLLLTSRAAYC